MSRGVVAAAADAVALVLLLLLAGSLLGRAIAAGTGRLDGHAIAGLEGIAPDLRRQVALVGPARIEHEARPAAGLAAAEAPGGQARPLRGAENARLVAEHLDGAPEPEPAPVPAGTPAAEVERQWLTASPAP